MRLRGKVYRGSSDHFLDNHKKYIQQYISKPKTLYAIIGGLGFLNLIAYLNPSKLVLFDYNPFEILKIKSFIGFINKIPQDDLTTPYFYEN